MSSVLVRVWRTLGGALQWRTLWLFHAKFILGVSAIVLDDSRRVLLLRHKFWKAGSWGLPSGYAVSGETLEATVRREIKEETNFDVNVSRLHHMKSGFKLRLEITFVASLEGGEMKLDSNEIIAAEFFDLDTLPPGLLQSHRDLIHSYRATLG